MTIPYSLIALTLIRIKNKKDRKQKQNRTFFINILAKMILLFFVPTIF